MPRENLSATPNTPKLIQAVGNAGSTEQERIWNELDSSNRHVIVNAVAGSGKTYTGVEWCKRGNGGRTAFVAFNKHIATELQGRLQGCGNVEAMTYHSLGFRMVKHEFGRVEVDQYKVDNLLENVSLPIPDEGKERTAKYRIKNLVSLAKQYGVSARADLEVLVDHHDVDLTGVEEVVYEYVPKILHKCKEEMRTVDFDDMIWIPWELRLRGTQYDTMLIDEAQDTNRAQQWLALNTGKRLVVIGDKYQAIYGFRGSDHLSMSRIGEELGENVVELPLSVTRRCPKAHVGLAQVIVPHIRAMEVAIEGEIRSEAIEKAVNSMGAGDLVLCRVNAELIGVAYQLLKRGVKAVVRGRDIGKGLEKLIDRSIRNIGLGGVQELIHSAAEVTQDEVGKFMAIPRGRGEARAHNARDRFECLLQLSEGAKSISELRGTIAKIFADFNDDGKPNNAVVLGTVHRTKGLESDRVFVLRPDLIPHPMAKQVWEQEQERNLAYVAVTRSKRELIWVGGECSLFT